MKNESLQPEHTRANGSSASNLKMITTLLGEIIDEVERKYCTLQEEKDDSPILVMENRQSVSTMGRKVSSQPENNRKLTPEKIMDERDNLCSTLHKRKTKTSDEKEYLQEANEEIDSDLQRVGLTQTMPNELANNDHPTDIFPIGTGLHGSRSSATKARGHSGSEIFAAENKQLFQEPIRQSIHDKRLEREILKDLTYSLLDTGLEIVIVYFFLFDNFHKHLPDEVRYLFSACAMGGYAITNVLLKSILFPKNLSERYEYLRKLLIASTGVASIAMIVSSAISTTGTARVILRIGYRVNNANYRFSRILSSRGISCAVINRMDNTYNSFRNDQFLSDEQDILFIRDGHDALQCLRATFSLTGFVLIIPISSFDRYNSIFYDTLSVSELANIFYSGIGLIYSWRRHGNKQQLSSYYRRTITNILVSTAGTVSINVGNYLNQPLFIMVGATCIFANYGYSLLKDSTPYDNINNKSTDKVNSWTVYRANFNTIRTLAYIDALVFERVGIMKSSVRKGLPIAFEPLFIMTELVELYGYYAKHYKPLSTANKFTLFRTFISILITVLSVVSIITDDHSSELIGEIIDMLCWGLLITPIGAFDIYTDSMSQYGKHFRLSSPITFFKRAISDDGGPTLAESNSPLNDDGDASINREPNTSREEVIQTPLLKLV